MKQQSLLIEEERHENGKRRKTRQFNLDICWANLLAYADQDGAYAGQTGGRTTRLRGARPRASVTNASSHGALYHTSRRTSCPLIETRKETIIETPPPLPSVDNPSPNSEWLEAELVSRGAESPSAIRSASQAMLSNAPDDIRPVLEFYDANRKRFASVAALISRMKAAAMFRGAPDQGWPGVTSSPTAEAASDADTERLQLQLQDGARSKTAMQARDSERESRFGAQLNNLSQEQLLLLCDSSEIRDLMRPKLRRSLHANGISALSANDRRWLLIAFEHDRTPAAQVQEESSP